MKGENYTVKDYPPLRFFVVVNFSPKSSQEIRVFVNSSFLEYIYKALDILLKRIWRKEEVDVRF